MMQSKQFRMGFFLKKEQTPVYFEKKHFFF